jgi:hypothetical protein
MQLMVKAVLMASHELYSIYRDRITPPYAKVVPIEKRFSSSAGASEMPGYRPMIQKIRINTGR